MLKKLIKFIIYKVKDVIKALKEGKVFSEYGMTVFCGRQGAGKTMAMVEYLERMRLKYPKCIIVTNFNYINETQKMKGWKDIFNIRNGLDGVIFAIDEIQNEYNSMKWKDFPESLLSEITQQRKQRIKIIATSQVFTRVVKQLREQAYEVVECATLAGRWTFTRYFDADDYINWCSNPSPELKKHIKRLKRYNFIQTDEIREKYDTYEKVLEMADKKFIKRDERAS